MIIFYGLLNLMAAVFALNAYSVSITRGKIKRQRELPGITQLAMKMSKKYGITQKSDVIIYMIMPFTGVVLSIAALLSANVSAAIILLFTPSASVLFLLVARKKKASTIFQKNAYKLYKYILNQAAAGVRSSDSMRKMYEVVSDKKLRRTLKDACAKYSVSLDTDVLAGEIIENIDTPEARSFAMSIRDKLFETRDSDLMERLEQLMFNRYFASIQRATDGVKTRCLITVVMLCSVIVVMVLIPTFLDVMYAPFLIG